MPQNFAQKNEFRDMLKKDKKFVVAENFDEAIAAYTESFKTTKDLPDNLKEIYTDFATEIETFTEPFWVLVHALKLFHDQYQTLPVSGTLPDMVSTTAFYNQLQKVYQDKALKDRQLMKEIVEKVCQERQIEAICEEDLIRFCKHALVI